MKSSDITKTIDQECSPHGQYASDIILQHVSIYVFEESKAQAGTD
jgi:hypothetical protein